MTGNYPSTNWTESERLRLIGSIIQELDDHPMIRQDKKLFDIQERILFISTKSAKFLEANRKDIVEGKNV